MKKITGIFIAALLMMAAVNVQAQKTGYIRVDDMVSLMPELAKIDTMLAQYQNDSLPGTFNYLLGEYQRYDSIAKDSTKPVVVRNDAGKKSGEFLSELQNWQSTAQAMIENKQSALLQPVYAKVMKAIEDVAKEKGYAYVYNREALLVAPPADDLLPLVAAKLNVKVPPKAATPAK
ncbi:MAG: hypothetical protein GC171_03060 [Terrimonas sp.]|nr:hypothetical protein [Terrimonas sp.]